MGRWTTGSPTGPGSWPPAQCPSTIDQVADIYSFQLDPPKMEAFANDDSPAAREARSFLKGRGP